MKKLATLVTIVGMLTSATPAFAHGDPGIQPINNPALGASCGLDVVLVLDSSGSIDSTELSQMKTAFTGFVNALLPNETQIAVVDFDSEAAAIQGFSGDETTVNNAVNSVASGGTTNWDDALFDARSLFPHRVSNPDLILFASDGNPNRRYGHSSNAAESASETLAVEAAIGEANAAKTTGVHIKTIGIGGDLDSANLADLSYPDPVITSNFDTLATDLADLAHELCDQVPPPGDGSEGDVTVTNSNNADVHNVVISSASTGGNYAGGSAGGDGGNGGSIRNSGGSQNVDDSATGSGGTGGNGGLGGTIYTGNAGASASATNVVNVNDVTIDRCACAGGDNGNDTVVNGNNAEVGNFVLAKAKTGWNRAEGSSGGDGGRGGKISNSGGLILVEQDEENGYSSQNVDDTTTGAGGNGGTGGNGGLVRTGNAGSVSAVVNTTNVSVVRIRR